MGISVFIFNGITSIAAKVHQVETVRPIVSSMDYVILTNICRGIVSLVVIIPLLKWQGDGIAVLKKSVSKKPMIIVLIISAFSGLTSFCLVQSAVNLPATVLYPLNTGGK